MKNIIGAALALLLLNAGPALADHGQRDAGVDERQHRLEQRIEHGARSGELTPREFYRLHHELREIHRAEYYFRADGRLSGHEREELHARLDGLSRDIYRQKHDGQRRHGSYNRDAHAFGRY
jgi:hypothetical protein